MRAPTAFALAASLAVASAGAAHAQAGTCVPLPAGKIGLQTYSVYEAMTGPLTRVPGGPFPVPTANAEQLKGFLGQLKAMGWTRFENFANTFGEPTAEYVATVRASGMRAVSSHDDLKLDTWNAVLDRAVALGQTYVGSGGFGGPGLDTLEHVQQTAANLNVLGEAAAKRGLKFFVHSHSEEFTRQYPYDLRGDGKLAPTSAWEIIAARTNPRFVNFEVDIAWAYRAYGPAHFDDLLAFLRAHRNRIPLLHYKDITDDGKIADLGKGAIDFKRVVDAAGPNVAYYIWEYDHPAMPMASAKVAIDFMTCKR